MDLFQRANWLTGSTRTTGLARTDANTYTENGGIATRTRSEDLLVNTTPFGRQTYETWSYDANNLVERYTRASVVKSQNLATGCYPDALTAPRDDWRYRYAPFMEREQKRQVELSSGEYQLEGLAWVYYGLGGDKKQLSVWNGVQGTWCLQNNHVFLWPVEYNSYGPMNTRIITRAANGEKEIVFTDHLGSTVQVRRGAPEYGADQRAYTAFGEDVNLPNEALMGRTGYIGRETDNESALGFYGVRQYDAGYGRFLSVDPLWSKYTALTPYQYTGNNPIIQLDMGGTHIEFIGESSRRAYEQAKDYILKKGGQEFAKYFVDIETSDKHTFYLRATGSGIVQDNYFNEYGSADGAYEAVPPGYLPFISWDARHALEFEPGKFISPALILFHEIVHAHGWLTGTGADRTEYLNDPMTSAEEGRAIEIEHHLARKLGESLRRNHIGVNPRLAPVSKVSEVPRKASKKKIKEVTGGGKNDNIPGDRTPTGDRQ